MLYKSTRGGEQVCAAEAIARGIASDGGLFVPEGFPAVTVEDIKGLVGQDYLVQAAFVLEKYLTDYGKDEVRELVGKAYSQEAFPDKPVVLRKVAEGVSVLELWHGPTFAFKDMALQLLPHLLIKAVEKTGEKKEVVILVATSGDTGKAALEGFADVAGTRIIVFYPEQGVSQIQKLQMLTQTGKNVDVLAVQGNFDDAQSGVKEIFNDKALAEQLAQAGYCFSSANSINWGRLVPQIVYYFSAYAKAVEDGSVRLGDKVNFVVPTGNFGNILAGFYARCMGLPVGKFVCASNSNNVLADFIATGVYDRRRKFHKTISPSMDILVSSNLERLLYHLTDGDAVQVAGWMKDLAEKGSYDVGKHYRERLQGLFFGCWVDDGLTEKTIADVFFRHKYLLDTHTAVAWLACEQYREVSGDDRHAIVLSTASPFKFADAVLKSVESLVSSVAEPFVALTRLSDLSGLSVPKAMKSLENMSVLHDKVVSPEGMKAAVKELLGVK